MTATYGNTMNSAQFSVRLSNNQKQFLDSMAVATDTTRNQLVGAAVNKMMENYKFVLAKLEQGDADYEAGRVVSMDEAEKRIQAVLAAQAL